MIVHSIHCSRVRKVRTRVVDVGWINDGALSWRVVPESSTGSTGCDCGGIEIPDRPHAPPAIPFAQTPDFMLDLEPRG